MPDAIARACILGVTGIAFARSAWVVAGFVRTLLRGPSLSATRWGWVELLVVPEPLVLAALSYALWTREAPVAALPPLRVAAALAAGVFAAGGVALTIWAFLSLPSVGSGHYVLERQPIVDRGAYGWLRHPIYLAAFMIWIGLALAYLSLPALLLLGLYVIPIYSLYIREEEKLMVERYGDAYRDYRERVGGLMPHLRR
jgi:protein-S-isoprenylcysteine O-methyltransferase Ste14